MADDFNISPEMINNMVNMLKNSGIGNNSSSEIEETDTSSLNADTNTSSNSTNISDLLSKFTSNANNNTTGSSDTGSIDFETIMKMKSIMESLNSKNDPRSNLLSSLKPYLRKSKQSKLDQYSNLLKITQVTGLFKTDKGESK